MTKLAVTVPRAQAQAALDGEGTPTLVLELRRGEELRTLELEWTPPDVSRLLERQDGETLALLCGAQEIDRALDADVEAHGVRDGAPVAAALAVLDVPGGAAEPPVAALQVTIEAPAELPAAEAAALLGGATLAIVGATFAVRERRRLQPS